MKYKIPKMQLGSVLNPRTISGTKSKSGNIQWEDNFDITTPDKQAVMLPGVTVTPSISIGNLQREVDEWNKKYPQSTSEVPIVAKLTGDKQLFTRTPKVMGMSGADPVGQFIVEGAILGKPTQYILDKGLTAAVGKTSGELLGQAWGFTKNKVSQAITRNVGDYGNPLQSTIGTIARRYPKIGDPLFKYGIAKPQEPTLIRKVPVKFENGKVLLGDWAKTGFKKQLDDIRYTTHYTTDNVVRGHNKGNWNSLDAIITPFKTVQKQTEKIINIEPSDSYFIAGNKVFGDKNSIIVSGNRDIIKQSQQNNLRVLTSKNLQNIFEQMKASVPKKIPGKLSLDKLEPDFRLAKQYQLEMDRLIARRGSPRIEDYNLLEKITGLKPKVIPNKNSVSQINTRLNQPIDGSIMYPNNRIIENPQKELGLMKSQPYRNVFFDPSTYHHHEWLKTIKPSTE